ncbi:ABC transporter ATP-binding protein [Natronocalculus amylovorans]|uniref:ABC transporter ATP-binding protein n=1 Tax=Natronocalculus amylovorans TaxID=2917812 RepID=A0AAE3G0W6_9EURY|nr:ABC transporter ATP-binding protein [Natronocalculus amylovorans]MCL9818433.1 ABC transporter ATP-binding protein [Natronocalculus amylovorans]
MALLEIKDLTVRFYTQEGVVTAVDNLSYQIKRGEKFGVVGESGAGKSVTALSLMRLIDSPGRIESGEILFKGQNILDMTEKEVRSLRGNEISMIFQDAQTALNPVYTVGEQISEAMRHHLGYSNEEARERSIQLLDQVGIPEAETRYSDYPHEFSGGMQQRAVIAMALSCDPDLLLCDEPTTALDVTIETQILDLIEELADEFDTAVQLITHDLGVVADICDRVMVMYAGKPVEKAPVEELYYDPKHPYTVGLMSSIPRVGDTRDRLQTIPGTMPDLVELPPGCSFHPRCPFAEDACTTTEPALIDIESSDEATVDSSRAAACLEYTDQLQNGLDYEVRVVDENTGSEMNPTQTGGSQNV